MRNLQIPQSALSKLGCKQIIDVVDRLPVNPNYSWEKLAGRRNINDLTTIGLHHDDYPKASRAKWSDIDFMVDVAKDHIKLKKNEKLGDAGFPYHFWIRNGQVYQTNNVLDRTYGIGGNNGYIVHICVSGRYTVDNLTDEDRNALLGVMYALTVALPAYKEVKAHCELNPTACPVYNHAGIREDLKKLQLQINSQSDPSQIKVNAYKSTEQHRYLYNQYISDPVNNKWLEPHLLKLHEFMKDNGMYFGQ